MRYVDNEWQPWAQSIRERGGSNDPPPEPSELIKPWLSHELLQDYQLEEPPIHDQISIEVDYKFSAAKKLLLETWEQYLEHEWQPWAEVDRQLQSVQKIYNELYTTYQTINRLGEQYEIVIALGLLDWNSPASGRLYRHIMVCDVSMSFDAGAGQLFVSGNPNGIQLRVELDMLEPADRPQQLEIEGIEKEVKEIENDVWDEAFLRHMPKAFVNALPNDRGQYEFSLDRTPAEGSTPRIDLSPAVIVRKRSQRGFIRLLKEIADRIERTSDVPAGFREIVDPAAAEAAREQRLVSEDERLDDTYKEKDARTSASEDCEIYFPLPANKEQFEIARRLDFGRGVLVQGPPGTGKTHTITNLICHLLAHGSRVLITSETPRGLQSIRSKFKGAAAPIADLCVLLLGNDARSIEDLERSVQSLNSKLNSFKRNASDELVTKLTNELMRVRSEKQKSEQERKAIREADTYKHSNVFSFYSGTIQEISQKVRSQKPVFDWLKDDLDEALDERNILTMKPELFVKNWLGLSDKVDFECTIELVELTNIPTAEVFAFIVSNLQSQEGIVAEKSKAAARLRHANRGRKLHRFHRPPHQGTARRTGTTARTHCRGSQSGGRDDRASDLL
ncbi:AAA domain-containing protein [Pirellulaceae bacterium]|nr:AAA domain-containing protein [Pirellulaceae bacterium]